MSNKISTLSCVVNSEMSATSALENNEDLENIPLVRMADVQPDRSSEMYLINTKKLIANFPCGEDEDSNIGSMVSIQSEEVVEDECNETELILPENVDTASEDVTVIVEKVQTIPNPEQWPTLEILPGGVIKYADRYEEDLTCYQNDIDSDCSEMMYACAKCPQRFNYLFSLVKHVKLHEIQKKKEQELELISISLDSSSTQKSIPASQMKLKKHGCPHKNKKKGISKLKTKCKVPKRS